MKRTWLVWALVGGIVLTVLIAFNYERNKETAPLSEIFPEKDNLTGEVEYEFVDTEEKSPAPTSLAKTTVAGPVAPVTSPKSPSAAPGSGTMVGKAAGSSSIISSSAGIASSGSTGGGKTYTIQVAAFKEKSRADKAVEQAQQKGYSAYLDTRTHNDGTTWYQMCIGRFDVQESAKELLLKVKQDYQEGFIKVLSGR